MPRPLKIILFVGGGCAGLLVCALVALVVFVDVNAYKPRFEKAASEALGMEIRIGGRLDIGLFPALHVTLADTHIRNRGVALAAAKEARLRIKLLPLLHEEIRFGIITLVEPRISIVRDSEGIFNFEKPRTATERILPSLDLPKVSFSDGTLLYANKRSGQGFEADDCNVDLSRLRFSGGSASDFMENLSMQAEVSCAEIRVNDHASATDLRFSVGGQDGIFEIKPVVARAFGGRGKGSLKADFSGDAPLYKLRCSVKNFRIEQFLKILSLNKVATGLLDFSANLSIQDESGGKNMRTMTGNASLRGENLRLIGIDIDRRISRIESSQNFNLVDMGALFFIGPWGLAVTKGFNFEQIFQDTEGQSEIRTLSSDWKVKGGVAQAQDVALTTAENRIALQGGLDFVNDRFNDLTLAVVDDQGCVIAQQQIKGTFREPKVKKASIIRSLTGPARNLLKKGVGLLGGECKVFYSGAVAPPK